MAIRKSQSNRPRQSNGEPPIFEEAFAQLRETVETLERGGLTLEEATRLFDKGMHLAKTCNELLTTAELKITRLQRTFGQQMAILPLEDADPADPGDDMDDTFKEER